MYLSTPEFIGFKSKKIERELLYKITLIILNLCNLIAIEMQKKIEKNICICFVSFVFLLFLIKTVEVIRLRKVNKVY